MNSPPTRGRLRLPHAVLASSIAILSTAPLASAGTPFHAPYRVFPTGFTPSAVSVADLDGDGILDLVAHVATRIVVMPGVSDGTYGAPVPVSFPGNVCGRIAIGDVTGDGRSDLVFADCGASAMVVLPGLGGGTFGSAGVTATGSASSQFAAGDFDGDGRADVACARYGHPVSLLHGNADGTFRIGASVPMGSGPDAVRVADFDRDGDLDLAALVDGSIAVVLGVGDGTFQPATLWDPLVDPSTESLVVGDIDGDGVVDLAAFGFPQFETTSFYSLLRGIGDGTFATPESYYKQTGTVHGEGDVNGDGRWDVIHTYLAGSPGFQYEGTDILVGTTEGWLGSIGLGVHVSSEVTIADLDGDAFPDLALTIGGGIAVYRARGPGSFRPPEGLRITDGIIARIPDRHVVADVDVDGRPDLIYSLANDPSILVDRQSPTGRFDYLQQLEAEGRVLALGDLNGDGLDDLVARGHEQTAVMARSATGGFHPAITSESQPYPTAIAVADFDGDGHADVASAHGLGGGVEIQRGDGSGAVAPFAVLLTAGEARSLHAADLDQDDDPDLVLIDAGDLAVFRNRGDGTFDPRDVHDLTPARSSIEVADVDHDDDLDLVLAGGPGVATMLGQGDGTFTEVVASAGPGGTSITLVDWNGDGDFDAVVRGIALWLYEGDGQGAWHFASGLGIGTGSPGDVRAADLDLDGRPDLAVMSFRQGASGITFLRGKDAVDPVVALDSPQGGEVVIAGHDHLVRWTASDDVAVTGIDLLLLRHGTRGPIETIARGLPPTGSYSWRVTAPATDSALVRILARDDGGNTGRDQSAGYFEIEAVVATLLERFTAEPTPTGVVIRWRFAGDADLGDVRLERAETGVEQWAEVTAARDADGGGWKVHDLGVESGGLRRYRLVSGARVFGPIEVRGAARALDLRVLSSSPVGGPVRFEIALPGAAPVLLTILDVQGRTITLVAEGVLPGGLHEVEWAGAQTPPGLYFARLSTPTGALVRRVILMR
jgi:hypothetical protein